MIITSSVLTAVKRQQKNKKLSRKRGNQARSHRLILGSLGAEHLWGHLYVATFHKTKLQWTLINHSHYTDDNDDNNPLHKKLTNWKEHITLVDHTT